VLEGVGKVQKYVIFIASTLWVVNVLHIMLVPQTHPLVAIHCGTPEIRFLTNEFNSALTSMALGKEPGTRV
jgi:hypothetical protein